MFKGLISFSIENYVLLIQAKSKYFTDKTKKLVKKAKKLVNLFNSHYGDKHLFLCAATYLSLFVVMRT